MFIGWLAARPRWEQADEALACTIEWAAPELELPLSAAVDRAVEKFVDAATAHGMTTTVSCPQTGQSVTLKSNPKR